MSSAWLAGHWQDMKTSPRLKLASKLPFPADPYGHADTTPATRFDLPARAADFVPSRSSLPPGLEKSYRPRIPIPAKE